MLDEDFSHREVLGLWHGSRYLSKMARDIGVLKHRCRTWIAQNNVPPQYWPQLIEAVRARFDIEITTDQLTAATVRAAAAKAKASGDREAA